MSICHAGKTPLYVAVFALILAGADINTCEVNGETPLYRAAYEGHADIAHALISAGTDINASNQCK